MSLEIRSVTSDELDRFHFLVSYAFSSDRAPEAREQMKHIEALGQDYALYEDGEMAACLRLFPMRMFLHGASIPLSGVSHVACLPEQRRKGYVGRLLRHALGVMREQGQPLSSLWTPHPSLYRRYGWMVASAAYFYRFNPKEIAPADATPAAGSSRRISEEQWPVIAAVYSRFAAPRNGYLDRDELWWKETVFRRIYDDKRRPNDVAVWTDDGGEPCGYVVYHSERDQRPDGPDVTKLVAEELIALDGSAYKGLLRYLLSHDLAGEVVLWGRIDEPLPLAVDEPWRIKMEHWHGFMLRVVDVEQAIAARPAAAGAPDGAFTVHLADAAAPWNQGAWRIECSSGRLSAARADGSAGLSTDAAAFAAMYNGYLRPTEAVRSGLAQTSDPGVAATADRILSVDYPPHPADFF
ncbi:MAG: GNAT family N-acetyltransferase [Dehalococcoidia bacterium]|nr:GNAT family N-acetyltransferase [Dehalococcoidia bacterium]